MLPEAELLTWMIPEDRRPLVEAKFYTMCATWGLSAQEADALLSRVAHVLSDPTVISILHPEPELPDMSRRE